MQASPVALVTGASSGIGEALARLMGRQGWRVGLVARRRERLEQVLEDCPGGAIWEQDLGDPEAAAAVAVDAWHTFGHLDVLVNNAGIPMRRPVQYLQMADVERTMRTNYFSPVAMCLAVLPKMHERGSGVIVNVSSLGGRLGIATEAAYSASKFALAGFSEAMAADLVLAGSKVKVRLVLPGAIDTEIWDQPGNDPPLYNGPLEPVSTVAQGILDAIESDRFEHYIPDLKAIVEFKTSDFDSFLAGMVETAREGNMGERLEEQGHS